MITATALFNPDWQRFGQVISDCDIPGNPPTKPIFYEDKNSGDVLFIEPENRLAPAPSKDAGKPLFTITCWNKRDPRVIWKELLKISE